MATLTDKQLYSMKMKLLSRGQQAGGRVNITKDLNMSIFSSIQYVNAALRDRGIVVRKGVREFRYMSDDEKRSKI